jgi:hypothetical protein
MAKEEKLEYLKREEVKTMIKDVSSLREREARKERERIAALSPEEKKVRRKGAKKQMVDKPQEEIEISPTPKSPRKSLLTKKILIRGIFLLLFLFILGVLVWSFLENKNFIDLKIQF